MKVILKNKKGLFNYQIIEKFEAGIELQGTEIKSIREGRTSFQDTYIDVKEGEVWVNNWTISQYEKGGYTNHDPNRLRKLLLHKKEILRLISKVQQKGLTIIPVLLYFKGPYVKMEIALASGKRQYDKRQDIAKKDAQREIQRAFKKSY